MLALHSLTSSLSPGTHLPAVRIVRAPTSLKYVPLRGPTLSNGRQRTVNPPAARSDGARACKGRGTPPTGAAASPPTAGGIPERAVSGVHACYTADSRRAGCGRYRVVQRGGSPRFVLG